MKPIRVLLVDDHALIRTGLRALIQSLSGVEIVAEAGNGREAHDLVEQHHPDVVFMDLVMPELDGLEATAQLSVSHPDVRILILSMNDDAESVLSAIRAGAAGYVVKGSSLAEVETALRVVARGEKYLSPAAAQHVITGLLNKDAEEPDSLDQLTPRQREVLQLIALGSGTKQIARKLGISPKTVETHRAQLMETLGIHDVAGLVRYAIRKGLITSEK
jgi:DNA-binding NarL/FixJ family response regulator